MALQPRYLTPDEYLLIERRAETRSEYLDGVIRPMPSTTERHALVLVGIMAELHTQLRHTPCRVYHSNLKVQTPGRRQLLYPDVLVICERTRVADAEQDVVLNPLLIVEVLADATEAYDRGDKFDHYQQIESLEEYVLVSQDEPLIETYHRQADGVWTYTKLDRLDDTLTLRSVNCAIPLQTVYSKVEFPPRTQDDEDTL